MCLNPQVVGIQPTSVTPSDAAAGAGVCMHVCTCEMVCVGMYVPTCLCCAVLQCCPLVR